MWYSLKRHKKLIALIALSFIAGTFYYYQQSSAPIHFNKADSDFQQDKNVQQFEARKRQLIKYYTCGDYEQDMKRICNQAMVYFTPLCRNNSLIIFDIDDTAVYHYQVFDKFDFIWSHCSRLVKAKQIDMGPAIEPVLELYKNFIQKGFKIIFLSSRNEGDYDHTSQELKNAGYATFDKLILMPDALAFDRSIKTSEWKLLIRKELAKTYTIVGTIGDREADFEGGYTGYMVKLPNYLY